MRRFFLVVIVAVLMTLPGIGALADSDYGQWIVSRYVNEYQEQTDILYAANKYPIPGRFEQGILSGNAYFTILSDYYDTSIKLYQYNTNTVVKNVGSCDLYYNVEVRANGTTFYFDGTMTVNDDSVYFMNASGFDRLLCLHDIIQICILSKNDAFPSTYLSQRFSTRGFTQAKDEANLTIKALLNTLSSKPNQQLIASYNIFNGVKTDRTVSYKWEVYNGSTWSTAKEGELDPKKTSGTLAFAPGSGVAVNFYIIVRDSASAKAEVWQNVVISLKNKSLVLPENLKAIEDSAFEGAVCETVTIPDRCGYVGHGAFKNCKSLVLVSCKAGTVIEEDAFSGCDKLMPIAYR